MDRSESARRPVPCGWSRAYRAWSLCASLRVRPDVRHPGTGLRCLRAGAQGGDDPRRQRALPRHDYGAAGRDPAPSAPHRAGVGASSGPSCGVGRLTQGEGLPPAALAACLFAWNQLHGAISLEVFGHVPLELMPADDLFEQQMRQILVTLGCPTGRVPTPATAPTPAAPTPATAFPTPAAAPPARAVPTPTPAVPADRAPPASRADPGAAAVTASRPESPGERRRLRTPARRRRREPRRPQPARVRLEPGPVRRPEPGPAASRPRRRSPGRPRPGLRRRVVPPRGRRGRLRPAGRAGGRADRPARRSGRPRGPDRTGAVPGSQPRTLGWWWVRSWLPGAPATVSSRSARHTGRSITIGWARRSIRSGAGGRGGAPRGERRARHPPGRGKGPDRRSTDRRRPRRCARIPRRTAWQPG